MARCKSQWVIYLEDGALIVDETLCKVKGGAVGILRFALDSHGVFSDSMRTVSGTAQGVRDRAIVS